MRNTILIGVICLAIFGCSKNKFTTAPQLKFKSVNTTKLSSGEIISFTLSYTDAEGDLEDSIYVEKVEPNCTNSGFKLMYKTPEFPVVSDSEGEIVVSYGYNVQNYPLIKGPQCDRNDTCYFRFMLKDKEQHKSDTIESSRGIVIVK